MASAIPIHPSITTRQTTDVRILDAGAVLSTTLIQIHRRRLNRLARCIVLSILSPSDRRHDFRARCSCYLAVATATCPAIMFAPIFNYVIWRCTILPFLLGEQPPNHTMSIPPTPASHETYSYEPNHAPSVARSTLWQASNLFSGRSPPKYGLTPTTQRSVMLAIWTICINHDVPCEMCMLQKCLRHRCFQSTRCEGQENSESRPI